MSYKPRANDKKVYAAVVASLADANNWLDIYSSDEHRDERRIQQINDEVGGIAYLANKLGIRVKLDSNGRHYCRRAKSKAEIDHCSLYL